MRRHLGTLLIATGLLLACWPAITWAYGVYWQDRLARDWRGARQPGQTAKAAEREQGSAGVEKAPEPEVIPVARIVIDRIGLDTIAVEGVDDVSLRRGPGHLPKSGYPGESRNCAIAAHRDGWFIKLPSVQVGDVVYVETETTAFEYVIEEKRVATPDRTDLLETGSYPTLTLITCTGPRVPLSTHRLLVFCRLQSVRPL